MRNPPYSGHTARHIERAADNATPFPGLRLPYPAAVSRRHLPGRIIRGCRDDGDAVPAAGKPSGHLAGIFANTREFRRKVKADDKEMHDYAANPAICENVSTRFRAITRSGSS